MQPALKQYPSSIEQNISYYNEIAEQYDEILDGDYSNENIRQKVAFVFMKLLPGGLVLDFGGGTGRDLPWLAENGYKVIFCEPSVKMREKAIQYSKTGLQNNNIVFLKGAATDFAHWPVQLPFSQKADAVLANFAVINNIPAIAPLFKHFSLVTRPGAHLLMLVLRTDLKNNWRSNRLATLRSMVSSQTVTIETEFNGHRQKVYLHSTRQLKKAAAPWFRFQGSDLLKARDFSLLHFSRK